VIDEAKCESCRPARRQIGLARIITDYVSFAYLTDVYVLESHQGKGLGAWLTTCVGDMVGTWPFLRGLMLLTSSETAIKFYGKLLKAEPLKPIHGHELMALIREGPARDF